MAELSVTKNERKRIRFYGTPAEAKRAFFAHQLMSDCTRGAFTSGDDKVTCLGCGLVFQVK